MKALSFEVVTFYDKDLGRQILILYALGADGIIREYSGQKGWLAYPIPDQVQLPENNSTSPVAKKKVKRKK